MVDQALIMFEIVDSSTSRSSQVACAAAIKKNYRENRNRGYEFQIEEPYLVEKITKDKRDY